MRITLQPAYILHSRHYRDSSMLLEVLTAEHGRISLVARGARRKTRGGNGGALLQPFIPLLLSFSGRAELKTLTGSEVVGPLSALRGERMFSGLYVNELLVRLLHRHDPHPQLFAAYGRTLDQLASEQAMDAVLRRFEITLLDELGYGFDFRVDGRSGEAVRADRWYNLHADRGLVARPGAPDPAQPAFAGADLLAMAGGEFGGEVRRTAKRLLRQALAFQLGETSLRSRDLFRARAPVPCESPDIAQDDAVPAMAAGAVIAQPDEES